MPLIDTESELDEWLSRPNDSDVTAMSALKEGVLILGAAGKMGPSLAQRARRAADLAGTKARVIAVARFTDQGVASQLERAGIETIQCDLLEPGALNGLPDVPNVIFMAARKFGTSGSEHLTWAMNTFLPGLVAERYRKSRIVSFSTGNVYPLTSVTSGGATELTMPQPIGEYSQAALGRERMFEYGSNEWKTRVTILRLNYAVELRYGVLLDIGRAVFEGQPVDVTMPLFNVIWQGDANSACLRSFALCDCPPKVINLTGPETLSVRYIADQFARRLGKAVVFRGEEGEVSLLNNAALSHQLFGYPAVSVLDLIDAVAHWLIIGGTTLNKPTRFQVRDGRF